VLWQRDRDVLRSTFVPLNETTLQYTVQYPEFRRKAITAKPLDAVRAASMIRMRASSVLTASTTHYAMARTHYTICFVSLECVQGTNSIQCELHLTCIAHLQKIYKAHAQCDARCKRRERLRSRLPFPASGLAIGLGNPPSRSGLALATRTSPLLPRVGLNT
jgi:hypothetical protein